MDETRYFVVFRMFLDSSIPLRHAFAYKEPQNVSSTSIWPALHCIVSLYGEVIIHRYFENFLSGVLKSNPFRRLEMSWKMLTNLWHCRVAGEAAAVVVPPSAGPRPRALKGDGKHFFTSYLLWRFVLTKKYCFNLKVYFPFYLFQCRRSNRNVKFLVS